MRDSLRFSSPEEQLKTEQQALTGDAESAKRLAEYYYFVAGDEKQARRWWKLAASYGDEAAKKSLQTLDNS